MTDEFATPMRRFLTMKEVEALLGCSRTSLWRLREADPRFPQPIRKWSDRRVLGFDASLIETFMRDRVRSIEEPETQSASNCNDGDAA